MSAITLDPAAWNPRLGEPAVRDHGALGSDVPDPIEADLSDRPSVSLAELTDQAALLTRCDRKYVLPEATLPALLALLDPEVAVLSIGAAIAFGYGTVYFDTDELCSFHDAAHRRPRRWKVRLRSYLDTSETWCEVKVRDRRGRTVKHRLPRSFDAPDLLDREERALVVEAAGTDPTGLRPVLHTAYRRITLFDPDSRSRTTLDRGLRCDLLTGGSVAFEGSVVVETKTAGRPSSIDRLLWGLGHRPVRFSKYATGLAALRPDLPANRWHRTLTTIRPGRNAPDDLDCWSTR